MHRGLDDGQRAALAGLQLPLPSARLKLDPVSPEAELVRSVLAEEGLEQDQLKLRGLREVFFSKGERPALSLPEGLTHATAPDERHPGHDKLTLAFDLRRGSYATMIVKRVTEVGPAE